MIEYNQIEAELGVQTMMTDRQQAAIQDWYRVAIKGEPCNQDPDTKALGLPAAICTELARLTTLELEVHVQGSKRADWIDRKMQKVISPRRRRSAVAHGSRTRRETTSASASSAPTASTPSAPMWTET